ncbi:hypothetical protein ACSNOI_39960, partial [Actinomadura kijaniata]|uniref:hypothetical protein n=1 Tax=Actinomadura kijaniata TaxID=46161 RepID=UPI003F1B7866
PLMCSSSLSRTFCEGRNRMTSQSNTNNTADGTINPATDLLSRRRYSHFERGAVGQPVTLAEEAATMRHDLGTDPLPTADNQVVLTPRKAMIVAALLEEFAARLHRDADHGALAPESLDYATLSAEFAEHLRRLAGTH